MRVRFSPEVVNEPTAWGCLDRIVFFFAEQRHLWDIDDPDTLKDSVWLQSDPGSRTSQRNLETLEKAFTRSIYPDQFVNSHSLCLVVGLHSHSERELSPEDAWRCLDAPVYVVVENAESDGAFLDAVIYALKRRVLLDAQTEGWWRLSHAGGAGEIPKEIERIRVRTMGPLRIFTLADGDRLYPGQRTKTGEQIETCCHSHGISNVVLHKREIENYLPAGILQRVPRRHRKTYKAFLELSQQQKDYYDMKSGFKMDARGRPLIPQEQQTLFQNVRSPVLRALCGGFGNDVWRYFITARNDITEDALKPTCCTCPGELDTIMDHIESLL